MGHFNVQSTAVLVTASLLGWSAVIHQPAMTSPSVAQEIAAVPIQPRLRFRSTSNRADARSTYLFTIRNPERSTPIKAVNITQNKSVETIRFRDRSLQAFSGNRIQSAKRRQLAPVGGSVDTGTITVAFNEPVQPGETVTIAVKPRQNPGIAGPYLFRVTAFAEPSDITGMFLGYGRLNILLR